MRKINSIGYGGKILGGAMLLSVGLPAGFGLVERLTGRPVWGAAAIVSACGGIGLFLFLLGLLAVELSQDKKLLAVWQSQGREKQKLKDGRQECPCCGNREIRESEGVCMVCGNRFEPENKEAKH